MQETFREAVSILVLGKSPGEGNGNPLQYSCLENPMDRGAWQATVHGVEKSQTQLKWRSTYAVEKSETYHLSQVIKVSIGSHKSYRLWSSSPKPELIVKKTNLRQTQIKGLCTKFLTSTSENCQKSSKEGKCEISSPQRGPWGDEKTECMCYPGWDSGAETGHWRNTNEIWRKYGI